MCISRGGDEDEDDGFRDERRQRQRNGTERWRLSDETTDASTATRVRRSRRRRPRKVLQRENEVFYNRPQVVNRDLSLAMIREFQEKERGIRKRDVPENETRKRDV